MPRHRVLAVIWRVLLLYSIVISTEAQRPINVLYINDITNTIANKSVHHALGELRKTIGKVYAVEINGQDGQESMNKICSVWDKVIQDKATQPDFVLDTTTYGPGAEVVNSFTAIKGIPTISSQYGQEGDLHGWRTITDEQSKYLIQIMSPSDVLPHLIRLLNQIESVTNTAILYDEQFVLYHRYKSLLLNLPCRHMFSRIEPPGTQVTNQIFKLRREGIINYYILGSHHSIRSAFDAGCSLKYIGHKYGWYGVTLETDFKAITSCGSMNVMIMQPLNQPNNPSATEALSTSLKIRSVISAAFFYDFTKIGVMGVNTAIEKGKWPKEVNFTECKDTKVASRKTNFLSYLKQASGNLKATFANFRWGSKNSEHFAEFNVTVDVYTQGSSNTRVKVASWLSNPSDTSEVDLRSKERLKNHTAVPNYRVVTIYKPPFMMKNNVTGAWEGYCIDLLDEIRKEIPFEYDIYEAPDGQYGHLSPDGSWNGMIKELIEKRADIALGAISVMAERETAIDYTVPYYDLVGISILMRRPRAVTPLFKFLTVLEGEVWIAVFCCYLFTSLIMWIFDRYSPYSYFNNQYKYRDSDEKRIFSLKESLWFAMTSLTPQGGGEIPKNLSSRCVAAGWWLFGFVIVSSYTANLAAFLTSARLEPPIQSLNDLGKQYKVQYAPILYSAEYRYFERMAYIEEKFYETWKKLNLNSDITGLNKSKLAVWDYPVSDKFMKMFKQMQDSGFPKDQNEALARLRGEIEDNPNLFAYIGDATDVRYLAMTNCDFYKVGEEFSQKPYAIAVQKGSPLKEQFNNVILSFLNLRKLERLKDSWWNRNPRRRRCAQYDEENDGISIKNIGGVFIVVFVGICFSCLILISEYFYYNCCQVKVEAIRDEWREKLRKKKDQSNKHFGAENRSRHFSNEQSESPLDDTTYPRKRF